MSDFGTSGSDPTSAFEPAGEPSRMDRRTVGRARQLLSRSVTRSASGDDREARRCIRESMQLLDAALAEVEPDE